MSKLTEWISRLQLWRDKRGIALGAGIVGALVGILVMILIGIIVVQSLVSSQTQAGWSATANTTWASLQSNIWVAFTLIVIIPVIIGAVVILQYVRQIG